jgi:hypothetical protein
MRYHASKMFLVFILMMTMSAAVFADPMEGWKGYGLYPIGGTGVTIVREEVSISTHMDKLSYSSKITIRNNGTGNVKAAIGMPVQGIEKIDLNEKNTKYKYKKRTIGSLQNEFNIQDRLPQEESWYVFTIALKGGETKLLDLSFDTVTQEDEQNTYSFTYFNDRNLGFFNHADKSSLYIDISNFKPYNLIELEGLNAGQIGIKGDAFIKKNSSNVSTVYIKYTDIDKAALGKLQVSAMYKTKDIASNFLADNYSKAIMLCDEYAQNPLDSQISAEQIQYIKAESQRRLGYEDKYLTAVENMDYSRLYPSELKYKILYDRMNLYIENQQKEKLVAAYKELEEDASPHAKYLVDWMNSHTVFNPADNKIQNVFNPLQGDGSSNTARASKLQQIYKQVMDYSYTPYILFAAGIILGLLLKRGRAKKKRRKSMYLFRP